MYYIDFVEDHFVVVCCFDMTISDYRKAPLTNLRSAIGTEYVYCADSFRDFVTANNLVKKLNLFYTKNLDSVDVKAPSLYQHFTVRKCSDCGKYYIVLYENRHSQMVEPMCTYCFAERYEDQHIHEFYGIYYVNYDEEEGKFVVSFDGTRTDTYEDTFNLSNLGEKIKLPKGLCDVKYSRNADEVMASVDNLNDYLLPHFKKGFMYDENFVVRKCRDCGKYFTISKSENDWIIENSYQQPVRCGRCRKGLTEQSD